MSLPYDDARCAGKMFSFRPGGQYMEPCRTCLRRTDVPPRDLAVPHMEPPITHDGERYVCAYRMEER